jgi:hypothetical protein
MSAELRGLWKESMGFNLRYFPVTFLEELSKSPKNIPTQHSMLPGRDQNLEFLEMEQNP